MPFGRLTRLLPAAALLMALLVAAAPALAQRVALVVGNGAYQAVPRLANPSRDAEEVAQALRALGFRVQSVRDASRAQLENALRQFSRDAAGAEVAAFFFAGHGMEVRGENLLIPVEARLSTLTDIDTQTIPVAGVMRAMQGAQARLIFLDACRDNPFAAMLQLPSGTRSLARGLGRIETADLGTLIAFATAPGTVAADGNGRNSPFTHALVRHLGEPGLDIRQVMTRVRRSVVEQTGGQQVPWDNSSLVSDLVLRGSPDGRPVAAAMPPLVMPAPAAPPQQQAALAAPPMTARSGPPPGINNWAQTRSAAAQAGIPLPDSIRAASVQQAGPYAAWLGTWIGGLEDGRRRIVVVEAVDPANGTVEVIYAQSDPGTRGNIPGSRHWKRYYGRISGNTLTFTTPWTFRMENFGEGRMQIEVASPPDFIPRTRFTHAMRRVE